MKKAAGGGTLFSYFTPVQKAESKTPAKNAAKKQPKTPFGSKSSNKSKTSPPSRKRLCVLVEDSAPVANGLLVWAKMDGHPWWPSMVAPHPASNKILRGKKSPEVHVQFFGQPPSRGWVPVTNLEILSENNLDSHTEKEDGFLGAMEGVRGAMKMAPEARLSLIVPIPSDEEEELESGGGMDEDDQENIEPMEVVPSGKKRPRPLADSDDSDTEIGVRKTLGGRPKRVAAMSIGERRRAKKRPRRVIDSDGSEEEYCPRSGEESDESDSCSSGVEEGAEETQPTSDDEEEKLVTPAKKQRTLGNFKTPKSRSTPTTGKATPKSALKRDLSVFSPTPSSSPSLPNTPLLGSSPTPSSPSLPTTPLLGQSGPFLHEKFVWLKEERKDKNGRPANHPDYNPRTLKVPTEFLKKCTPGVRQWWLIKSENFDTVLMFKVGKFYELYHMDAVLGVQELGLVFMKGDFAHSGFPEIAFGRYAQTLVQKGYKVARVEQTETPQMMEQRVKKMACPTKYDRVVRREVCSVISKGVRTLSFLDGDITDAESAYLLAIKEKPHTSSGESVYGVCFVDTSIGNFHLGQFSDDRQSSRLRTLIAHYPPAQVLYERNNLSFKTMQVVNQLLANTIRDCLTPDTEFWDAGKTLKSLAEGNYFTGAEEESAECEWPEALKGMLSEEDSLGLTASENCDLVVSALGAIVWCLRRCLVDHELLSLGNFEQYKPLDTAAASKDPNETLSLVSKTFTGQRMILDDITLSNLDVLDHQGKTAGTLLEKIDHCVTPFGKRLIKQWLCAPLCHPQSISERLDAVTDLMNNPSLVGAGRDVLRTLPDLERLLRKIRTMGSSARSQDHPDGRAIFYEETTYGKRKINDFISILDGFQASVKIVESFATHVEDFRSKTLRRIVTLPDKGVFPDMAETLNFFQTSFDHTKAKKEGVIVPNEGVNEEYDTALRDVRRTKNELEEYLHRQRKRLGCKNIVYWGSGRNRYQLEIPEAALSRHTPDDYELKSQKKGFRRYWTNQIQEMLQRLINAEDQRDAALKDTMRALFQSFAEHFKLWEMAVQSLAVLDVLMSLATYSSCSEGEMCRPEVELSSVPYVDIRAGRHPCIVQTYTGDDFIPNDVIVNGEGVASGRTCVVVTGPNMGGKSTLLRQTGLILILAQLGCYVPAESCRFSPVDRVFTRLGASDRIMAGESTFFVELTETATILQHSTPHSLVLLDELGRGTATYDGTAIACAVVRELAEAICCRTLFSTHYHSLVEEFAGSPHIQLGHMACMVENEDTKVEGEEKGEECQQETITFLYKFVEGACPKSYGFNAARLAGIPTEVIQVARRKAREFERSTERLRMFRQLLANTFTLNNVSQLREQISALC